MDEGLDGGEVESIDGSVDCFLELFPCLPLGLEWCDF